MKWPKWALAIINDATLGEFNYAAFLHDIGAMANTKLLRDENDKLFYQRLDAIVEAEKNFFKRHYLRFFKHFFYKAVRLNPGHYVADEIKIRVERALEPMIKGLEELRKEIDADRKATYEAAIELDKKRAEMFKRFEQLSEMQKKIESGNNVA